MGVSLTALPRYPVSPIFLKMKKRGLLEKIKRVLCRIPFRGGVPPEGVFQNLCMVWRKDRIRVIGIR